MTHRGDVTPASQDSVPYEFDLEAGIAEWRELESSMVASCEKIMSSTENMLVRTLASIIRSDSQKHFEVLDIISDALSGTVSITQEQLSEINDLIDSHIQLEEKALAFAEQAVKDHRSYMIHQLLSYLLVDEQKHHALLQQLRDYQQGLYPYR